jgi:hypothetical protein
MSRLSRFVSTTPKLRHISTQNVRSPRLILFDLANRPPCADSKVNIRSYSPNTIRSRFAIHHKRQRYSECWIPYPDIERLWQDLKIPAVDTEGTARPSCTLPVLLLNHEGFSQQSLDRLYSSNISGVQKPVQTRFGTSTPVASTLGIANALDALFPEQPALFPDARAIQNASEVQAAITRALPSMTKLVTPSVPHILDERSREYFLRVRKQWFNVSSLDEHRPQSQEEENKLWQGIEESFRPIFDALRQSSTSQGPGNGAGLEKSSAESRQDGRRVHYLSGTTLPGYADFMMVALLAWPARVDMKVWTRFMQLPGDSILQDLWDGCVPYLQSPEPVGELQWSV